MRAALILTGLATLIAVAGASTMKTEIELRADGRARVVHEWSSEAGDAVICVDIPKDGADGIALCQFAENSGQGWSDLTNVKTEDTPRELDIHATCRRPRGERSFRLSYIITGAVRRYRDVAEFQWGLRMPFDGEINRHEIEVTLPRPSPRLLKAFPTRSKPDAAVAVGPAADRISIVQPAVPGSLVSLRVLTMPEIFVMAERHDEEHLAAALARAEPHSPRRPPIIWPLFLLSFSFLVILPLLALWGFWYYYGREVEVDVPHYEREPPGAVPPIAVAAIMRQDPEEEQLLQQTYEGTIATLLDVARRGIVAIQEVTVAGDVRRIFRLVKSKEAATLDPITRAILDFYFGGVAGELNVLTDQDIRRYATQNPGGFNAVLRQFSSLARDWWLTQLGDTFVDLRSRNAKYAFTLCAGLMVVIGGQILAVALVAQFGVAIEPDHLMILGLSVLPVFMVPYFIAGRIIYRWSPSAYREHCRWKAFRRFLADYSALDEAPLELLAIWEQYYVYAVALGVAHDFLKYVGRKLSIGRVPATSPGWYLGGPETSAEDLPTLGTNTFLDGLSEAVLTFTRALFP